MSSLYFCGLNDQSRKENTKRNPWTYKRGIMLGGNNQANGIWKNNNNRTFRAQIRTKLTHSEFDYISTQKQKSTLNAWSSPHDNNVTERYRPISKLDITYTPHKWQMSVVQRNSIRSFRHKIEKMPLREYETNNNDDNLLNLHCPPWHRPRWNKPCLNNSYENNEIVYTRNLQEDTLPFISILFETTEDFDTENKYSLLKLLDL